MRLGRYLVLAAAALFSAGVVTGQTLVNYNPTGSQYDFTPVSPAFVHANLQASNVTQSVTNDWGNTDVWPNQIVLGALDTAHYVTLTLTGYKMTITSIEWDAYSYSNSTVNVAARTSLDGFASNVATASYTANDSSVIHPVMLDMSSLPTVSGPIEIRLYFYGSSSAGTEWADLASTNESGTGLTVRGTAAAPVPTVSETGFVVLLIALAIAGIVVLRGRTA